MNDYPKRLIEVDLPIARVSVHARAEKDSRLGHIPRLHIYPAARPVTACRAVMCAALWPDPADPLCPQVFRNKAAELISAFAIKAATTKKLMDTCSPESLARWEAIAKLGIPLDPTDEAHQEVLRYALLDFVADFAAWGNSTESSYLETSRSLSVAAHQALRGASSPKPVVADPFAGGGSIPLEAIRCGCDAFSSDLNPVSVLINRVILEYVPKYGNRLLEAILAWAKWATERAPVDLAEFYPEDPEFGVPTAFLWARTILSEAPGDTDVPVEVPLIQSLLLARKGRKVALRWLRDKKGEIRTEATRVTYADGMQRSVRRPLLGVFEPKTASEVEKGTAARNSATCPITGFTTSARSVRSQLRARAGGARDARLYCVVSATPGVRRRTFRIPTQLDFDAVESAAHALKKRCETHASNLPLVPDEYLPEMSGVFNAPLYGHSTWGSLFTERQLLAITTFSRLAREFAADIGREDQEFSKALLVLAGLIIDRLADLNASLCRWQQNTPNNANVFSRWALPMVMDFAEVNPLAGAGGSLESTIRRTKLALEDLIRADLTVGNVTSCSANKHFLPDDCVDLFFTDPPYYNAIPYADISDFFYVWLKRTIQPENETLLSSDLTPKADEICEMAGWDPVRYQHKDKRFFETRMMESAAEARRIMRPDSIGVFVFAHKSTSGWEAMLQAMIDGGLTITASWPIDTELSSRLRAQGSATLASSVHIVFRPRENSDGSLREEVGEWRDVLAHLPGRIHEWMPRLAEEGVVGADAIFACLGPALEIFSRYSRVEKASGEQATLREYLEHVWAAVSTEALSMIFKDADAGGLEPDARLTAMWLWTVGAGSGTTNGNGASDDESTVAKSTGYVLEFDAARKIAQGLGIHLEKSDSFVEVKGGKARLLPVAERTQHLFGKDDEVTTGKSRRKKKSKQMSLFAELDEAEAADAGWGDVKGPAPGESVLDRVHQSMILFAAGRSEAMKRFLIEDGAGTDARFWKLAQSLSALYPAGTDEKRWVDGVLARKKGLGL